VAIVIRVTSSWAKPHVVTYQGHYKFYCRDSSGTHPMDIDEIRFAFTQSIALVERIRAIRMDKISALVQGKLPIKLTKVPRCVVHVSPASAASGPGSVDLSRLEQTPVIRDLFPGVSSRLRYDLEGLALWGLIENDGSANRYLKAFRDGSLEFTKPIPLARDKAKVIFEGDLEGEIAKSIHTLFGIERQLGVAPPIFVMLSLLYAGGHDLNITKIPNKWGYGHPIDENVVEIPEVGVEAFDIDLFAVLRPVFDGVWLAAGWPRSMNYGDQGARRAWYSET